MKQEKHSPLTFAINFVKNDNGWRKGEKVFGVICPFKCVLKPRKGGVEQIGWRTAASTPDSVPSPQV